MTLRASRVACWSLPSVVCVDQTVGRRPNLDQEFAFVADQRKMPVRMETMESNGAQNSSFSGQQQQQRGHLKKKRVSKKVSSTEVCVVDGCSNKSVNGDKCGRHGVRSFSPMQFVALCDWNHVDRLLVLLLLLIFSLFNFIIILLLCFVI